MGWDLVVLLILVACSFAGLALIGLLRHSVIKVDKSELPIQLSRPDTTLASLNHRVTPKDETHGCVVDITVGGLDDATHDLLCRVALTIPKALLVSLRTIPSGPGATGHPPLLAPHPSYPSQLVLSDAAHDPSITLVILTPAAWIAEREVRLSWRVSEILEHANSHVTTGDIRLIREARIATEHQPKSYPDDRYSASFFMPLLCAPPTCMIGSGLFAFTPTLVLRAGSGLQHWELRTKDPESPTKPIQLGLRRGRGERLSIEALSLVPLLLTGVIAARLISDAHNTDLFIGSASVFLSIIALHSIVPPSAQAFGLTKADLRLQLGAAMMFVLILLAAIQEWNPAPAPGTSTSTVDTTTAHSRPLPAATPADTSSMHP